VKNPNPVTDLRAKKQTDKAWCKTAPADLESDGAGYAPLRHAERRVGKLPSAVARVGRARATVREEERKRISREVHDELGQSLTAIKIDLTWVMQRLSGVEEPIRRRIGSALHIVDETLHSVRRIAAELRPGILDVQIPVERPLQDRGG
jgi:signal transduction histidine kinase